MFFDDDCRTENKLGELRRKNGYTQAQLARKLGVAQNTVSGWEKGRAEIDNKHILMICSLFKVSIDYLFGNGSYNSEDEITVSPGAVKIPILGYVRAGYPYEIVENILDYEEIPLELARTGDFFALQIRGDSMAPRILDGDIVIIKKQSTVNNGQIAVLLINGDEATVKKVMYARDGITLIPLNPAYDPIFYSNIEIEECPVIILGRVVENRSKF